MHGIPHEFQVDPEVGMHEAVEIPAIDVQGMAGCEFLVSALMRAAASPMISTAFRMEY